MSHVELLGFLNLSLGLSSMFSSYLDDVQEKLKNIEDANNSSRESFLSLRSKLTPEELSRKKDLVLGECSILLGNVLGHKTALTSLESLISSHLEELFKIMMNKGERIDEDEDGHHHHQQIQSVYKILTNNLLIYMKFVQRIDKISQKIIQYIELISSTNDEDGGEKKVSSHSSSSPSLSPSSSPSNILEPSSLLENSKELIEGYPIPPKSPRLEGKKTFVTKKEDIIISIPDQRGNYQHHYSLLKIDVFGDLQLCLNHLIQLNKDDPKTDHGILDYYRGDGGENSSHLPSPNLVLIPRTLDRTHVDLVKLFLERGECYSLDQGKGKDGGHRESSHLPIFSYPTQPIYEISLVEDDTMILKIEKKGMGKISQFEAFVSFYMIEILKQHVPNFISCYCYFECESRSCLLSEPLPGYDSLSRVITMSSSGSNNMITSQDFVEIYWQVINALHFAYSEYKYTSYNLSPERIFVKKIVDPEKEPPILIKSSIDHSSYLTPKFMVKIFDHCNSSLTISFPGKEDEDVFLGGWRDPENEHAEDRYYPVSDSYQLLLRCAHHLLQNDNDPLLLLQVMSTIFEWFEDGYEGEGDPIDLETRLRVPTGYFGALDKNVVYMNEGEGEGENDVREIRTNEGLVDYLIRRFDLPIYRSLQK